MPPKKKQEEIDLSTLPSWTSKNIIVLCTGSSTRRQAIANQIKTNSNRMVRFIDELEIIQYAKAKQLYVDITTLTEKQKKQLKPETPTQLTQEVKAKGLALLINQLNIANRIQRKNKLDALNQPPPDPKKAPSKKQSKKQQVEPQPVIQKQYNKAFDSVYVLEKYPQTIQDFKELSKENQPINYLIVLRPEILYPEQQEEENQYEQHQQAEEQQQNNPAQNTEQPIKRKKEPKYPKQIVSQEEINHNLQVDNFVNMLKEAKKQVPLEAQFRHCLTKQIKIQINIDKEQQDIKTIPELVFQTICELSLERNTYDQWLKSKLKRQFTTQEVTQAQKQSPAQTFRNPLDLLMRVAESVEQIISNPTQTKESTKSKQLEEIQNLFDQQIPVVESIKNIPQTIKFTQHEHFNQNYWPAPQKVYTEERKDIFERLMLPGVQRTLMPQVPEKSYQRRRHEQSTYSNFITGNFDDFQRIRTISQFQKLLQSVESTRYSFNDRVYEEYHDRESLVDTFTKLFLHDPQILTKYDQKTDSLLVGVLFKDPDSKVNYRKWTSDWKTLPNFDNWINHIKNNDVNFKNQHYYDIDDLKLGKIEQHTKETSPLDGSIVVQKVQEASDTKQINLKVLKDSQVFGIKDRRDKIQFWYNNFGHRVSVTNSGGQFQIVISLVNQLMIVINQKGHVYQKSHNLRRKTLPNAYTIIYDDQGSSLILHPSGDLTKCSQSFSNAKGLGIIYPDTLKQTPTLKRKAQSHQVTKREDNTVLIEKDGTKWIKFYDDTTYQIQGQQIKIDKKGFAQGTYTDKITYIYQDVSIIGKVQGEAYKFVIIFKDQSKLLIDLKGITVTNGQVDINLEIPEMTQCYKCDFETKQLIYMDEQKISFKVENFESQKHQDIQHPERTHYSEPRLFLIRNDCSAAEFFSQKQLKKYFSDKSRDQNTMIKTTAQSKSQLVEVVSKIYPRPRLVPIRPDYPSNLDVLAVQPPEDLNEPYQVSTLRILSKRKDITNQDRQNFKQTLRLQAEWKAQNIKSNNQFGYREMDQQTLDREMKHILKMIQRRRQPIKQFPYYELKDRLLNQLVAKVVLNQQELQGENNMGLSFVQQKSLKKYKSEEDKQQDEMHNSQQQKYISKINTVFVPYQSCKNYFETPIGATALSQMPKSIFNPPAQMFSQSIQNNNTQGMLSSNAMSRGGAIGYSTPFLPPNSLQTITQSPIYQHLDQTNNNNQSKISQKQIVLKPSVFTQQDIDDQKKAFEEQKKAYQKRALKRKDVDVYGKERTDKPIVPALLRTQPISEVNQKHILVQSITDQKIKISSMKNRMMMNSSNLAELRKQGPHQTMLKSMDMGNTIEQINQKKTKMVHADLKDSLSRDILILPAQANFGVVKQNSMYQLKIQVKNQDVMCQRIAIKRPKTNMVRAFLNEMGPIPLGISRRVIVQLRTIPEMKGKFTDEFQIISKHQIYKIPVTAQIVSQQSFASMSTKTPHQSLLKLGVSELRIQSNLRGSNTLMNQLPKIQK